MRTPHIDDVVRLVHGIPELALPPGEIGVVRSEWFSPDVAYEVEFVCQDSLEPTRVLLLLEQIAVEENASMVISEVVLQV